MWPSAVSGCDRQQGFSLRTSCATYTQRAKHYHIVDVITSDMRASSFISISPADFNMEGGEETKVREGQENKKTGW